MLFCLDVTFRIRTRQRAAFLCSYRLSFSLYLLFVNIWCLNIVVETQRKLRRNHILFYRIGQTSIWSILCQFTSNLRLVYGDIIFSCCALIEQINEITKNNILLIYSFMIIFCLKYVITLVSFFFISWIWFTK